MPLPLYVADAFADRVFSGNPAAICFLDKIRDSTWMQAVAAEMNLSETAFLLCDGDAWQLRWFTPKVEVDLCGHATLASAHILWETKRLAPDHAAIFKTRSGELNCTRRHPWIEMDFPSEPPMPAGDPGDLLATLNISGEVVGKKRNRMDLLVEVADER